MCGITGFLGRGDRRADELASSAARMAGVLEHRGPDDQGVWVDEGAGIALGHRRLSILDLSPEGHQPMHSACGRYVLVFNGEIYNFRALRAELEGAGHRFRGHSDTEIMLAAFQQWGVVAAVRRFNGMFALALWDRRERRLHLVRDRLGEKPLYYGWCGSTLLFGSELKSLRAHPDFRGEIDREAVDLYLRRGYVPTPRSIFRGIRKLVPGTMVTVEAGVTGVLPEPVPYWSLREVARAGAADRLTLSAEDTVSALDELLRDAVGLRMVADVPLGAFLSGGIDSSTVVALMQAQSDRPVRTFTIGFTEASHNEAVDAKRVAEHLGTDHTEMYVTPAEAQGVVPLLPALYDEPFADSSQIPTYLVAQLARRSVTVSLSGDAGDELFGGYNRHVWAAGGWSRVSRIPYPIRRAGAGLLGAVPVRGWDRVSGAVGAVLPPSLRYRDLGDKVQKLAQTLSAAGDAELYGSLISHWREDLVPGVRPQADPGELPELEDAAERMMLRDTLGYLPDDILVKVDRATMGVSLEGRIPFLDHRVVELAWRIPPEQKIHGGQGKQVLRRVLDRYLPRHLVDRPKAGFAVPLDEWLRGPLRDWAEALLDPNRLRTQGLVDPAPVHARWAEHQAGTRNWQPLLWDVLMLQAWLDEAASAVPAPPLAAA